MVSTIEIIHFHLLSLCLSQAKLHFNFINIRLMHGGRPAAGGSHDAAACYVNILTTKVHPLTAWCLSCQTTQREFRIEFISSLLQNFKTFIDSITSFKMMLLRSGKKVPFIDQRASRKSKRRSSSSHCSSIGRKTPDNNWDTGSELVCKVQQALKVKFMLIFWWQNYSWE